MKHARALIEMHNSKEGYNSWSRIRANPAYPHFLNTGHKLYEDGFSS